MHRGRSTLLLGASDTGRTRMLAELRGRHDGAVLPIDGASPPTDLASFAGARDGDQRVIEHLWAAANGDPLLVLVDDVGELDDALATALLAATSARWCVAVVTAQAGRPLRFPRTEGWDVGRWDALRLHPLDPRAIAELAGHVLGGTAEPALTTALLRAGGGRPGATIELLSSALEAGCVETDAEVWRLRAPLPSYRLATTTARDLQGLGTAGRADAELLAFGAPLALRVAARLLTTVGQRELDRAGLVTVRRGDRPQLEFDQPIHAEILRQGVPAERRHEILHELAAAHDEPDMAPDTLLRVTRWRLEVGGWPASRWERAAALSRSFGQHDVAERAARRSIELGGGLAAVLGLAAALAERGQLVAARALLSEAEREADGEHERTQVAITSARGRALGGDVMAARRNLEEHAAGLPVGVPRAEASAHAAAVAAMHGAPSDVDGWTERAMRDAPDSEPARSVAALAGAVAATDRLHRVATGTVASETDADATGTSAHIPGARAAVEGLSLTVDEAATPQERLEAARSERDEALATGRVEAPWWMAVVGWLQLAAGRLDDARISLLEAQSGAEAADPLRLGPLVLADRALVAALSGEPTKAAQYLDELGDGRAETPRIVARAAVVDAWLLATNEGATVGAAAAIRAGDRAAEEGLLRAAVEAWHVAVRLGHAEVAELRLHACHAGHGHPMMARAERHARGVVAGDGLLLRGLALELAELGRYLLAAEVAAQAAQFGDERSAALASGFVAACTRVSTPALVGVEPVRLTPRQRLVASSVMSGEPPRGVADRMGSSVRTVENHLSRIYGRLGVTGRAQLARVHQPGSPLLQVP